MKKKTGKNKAVSPEKKQFLVVISAICLILTGSWLGARPLTPSVPQDNGATVTFKAPVMAVEVKKVDPATGNASTELKFYDVLEGEDVVKLKKVEHQEKRADMKASENEPVVVGRPVAVKRLTEPPKVAKQPKAQTAVKKLTTKPVVAPVTTSYIVQVASHKSSKAAQSQADSIKALGVKASVKHVNLGEKGEWYRVVCGPFVKKVDAKEAAMKIQLQLGGKTLVRKISN